MHCGLARRTAGPARAVGDGRSAAPARPPAWSRPSPTATSATSASVTEAGSRRGSSSSGTSRCSRSPTRRSRRPAGTTPPARARRRHSATWSGSGQNLSPFRGHQALVGQEGADVDALVEGRSKPSRRRLIRRSVSASATPIEVFGKDSDRSTASGSTPSSAGEPAPDVVPGRRRVEHEHVDPLGRHGLRPPLEHQPEVERAPVPDHRGALRDSGRA